MQHDPSGYSQYPRGPVQGRGPTIEHISAAVNLFAKAPGAYFVGSLPAVALAIAYLGVSFVANGVASRGDFMGTITLVGITYLVGGLLAFVSYMNIAGIVRMGLRQLRGEEITAGMVWELGGKGPNVFVATLLVGLATVVGTVFCVIPGLIVWGLSMLTYPYITEEEMSPVDAWMRSWRELQPTMLSAVGFGLLLIIIHSVSPGLLGFGLVIGQAMIGLYIACLYNSMKA